MMWDVSCIHGIKYISSTAEYCCPRPGSESEGSVDIIRDDGGRGWVLGCCSITQWLSRCQNTTWQSLIVTQLLGERTGRVTNISVYFKFDFIINFYASHLIAPTSAIPYHTANLELMTRKAFRKGIYLENWKFFQ